ncbi:4,5-DOPA dioxygenase extradiol [Actinoplanes lutulentus]|uniref:4,5-DOPA dioxygenase extradiol n=1 Tax=Actinoplanes lutulentus TaxID=1287878 RepID=A0A327YX90_9ACTN|nr:class III extradiol ring-cleavage dioxygenase [Actinoplanes lutulentus]MBB2949025.1 4,5-DOPA dioxygenase extradiol [Actinoplanes lutulentus]RAK26196.1 4,5-DOPA dioxygenase extradiol [Actinoplanes lutulentus]
MTSLSTTATADSRIPAQHPFAAHLRRAAAAEKAAAHRVWTPDDGPLPSLYISHGAPMLFEMADWMTQLHTWARDLPKPKAILIVSAHWESAPLSLSSTQPNDLVYDFGGFAPMYYQMRYDTPVATGLAAQVAKLMPDTEPVHEHRTRGLDHGAWVPLKIMYPDADIPVLQLSMPTHDPDRLLNLGRRLRTLRESGVLVIGSGYMTHGLPFLDWSRPDSVPGWSSDFDSWAADALSRGAVDELADFRGRAPGMPYAHPTVEHFTPLFVTLGAATDPTAPPVTAIDGYAIGLAKRSLQAA